MKVTDSDLPQVINITPAVGWYARYEDDDSHEEPIAAWGVLIEIDDAGERMRSVVGLVPEGRWLEPANGADNFKEYVYRGGAVAGGPSPSQRDEARRALGATLLWLQRAQWDPDTIATRADFAAHEANLWKLAAIFDLGRIEGV